MFRFKSKDPEIADLRDRVNILNERMNYFRKRLDRLEQQKAEAIEEPFMNLEEALRKYRARFEHISAWPPVALARKKWNGTKRIEIIGPPEISLRVLVPKTCFEAYHPTIEDLLARDWYVI